MTRPNHTEHHEHHEHPEPTPTPTPTEEERLLALYYAWKSTGGNTEVGKDALIELLKLLIVRS
jgi:hypothetical protein